MGAVQGRALAADRRRHDRKLPGRARRAGRAAADDGLAGVTGPLGLGFLGFPDLRALAAAGQHAEAAGFESAWVAETRITRDAVSGMTALLLGTQRLRVGSAAINVFTRGAGLTAVTWATLAEAAPGRVVLGIGAGSPTPLAQQGYVFKYGVRPMAKFVEAERAACTSPTPIDYHGRLRLINGLMP